MADETDDVPTGKPKNVVNPGGNIFEDSFFDTLSEIEDGIGKVDFTKLGEDGSESLQEIFKQAKPKEEKKVDESKKVSFQTLPTSPVKPAKENKESNMSKKQLESLGGFDSDRPGEEDPSAGLKEIWEHMNAPDTSEYRLMVFRLEPQMVKGVKISGFLEAFHLPITIPAIIEQVGQKYGGGKFQIRIVDGTGKYVKSKMFEISGFPKLPMPEDNKPKQEIPEPVASKREDNELDDESGDEEMLDDIEFDPAPRRRGLKPIGSRYSSIRGPRRFDEDPFPPLFPDTPIRGGLRREEPSKEDFEKSARELEDKILNKVDSKFDKLIDSIKDSGKKDTLFNPDVVKAFAPVVVSWLESKGNQGNVAANQFSETNKQIVGLMQGMQDLVRMTDKTKEEFAEKERRERDQSRTQLLEHQQKLEERFVKQQQMAEERHQKMLLEMKSAFESKQTQSASTESMLRLEYEKMREDFRLREEKLREEARAREERLREEQRIRDEENRRRDEERREQQRKDEEKWRDEVYRRDEEARKREAAFQDMLRQREIESIKESKNRETEIMDKFRALENQKIDMQAKLMEQVYSSNINNRENQLHMDLAIAKLNSETEAKMLQAKAQMELEKLRHQTQMHMTKVKHDLDSVESKRNEDPVDAAMQDYLKKRLQIDMVNELNMGIDDDDIPNNGTAAMMKNMMGIALQKVFEMFMGGGAGKMPLPPTSARPVSPTPQAPKPNPAPAPVSEEDEDEDEDEDEIDDIDESDESDSDEIGDEEEAEEPVAAEQELDPMQEIPRVASFFEYLKGAIETNSITYEDAAKEANLRLSAPIVEFLKQVEDSQLIINQLQPLLMSVCGPDLTAFYFEEKTIRWMNNMLICLRGGTPAPEEPEPTKEEEASKTKEDAVAEKPAKKKPGRKKKSVSETSNA